MQSPKLIKLNKSCKELVKKNVMHVCLQAMQGSNFTINVTHLKKYSCWACNCP